MKILHINQSDIRGGAAIAGYRLHQGLLKQGVETKLLVGTMQTDDPQAALIPRRRRLESQLYRFTYRLGFHTLNSVGSFDISNHPFFQEADILNFHNLHSTGFSYLAVSKLTQHKPAVFTLHDMWSFTGHCSYSYDCDRWKIGCGSCPYPGTYPPVARDSTRWEWKLKNWVYSQSDLTIVTPSHWLAEQARSSMLDRFSIHCIPYGIDTEMYQPLDPVLCREALGLSLDKKILLFSAANLKESRKGGDLLVTALQKLPKSLKQGCILLTFGKPTSQLEVAVDIPTVHLGYVSNDRLKAIAYSAADLFVFPTRADNLPLVLQESMACGTPMVSFKIGGVPDLVRPGITGYLAEPENSIDLCDGIVKLLGDDVLRGSMGKNCREIAVREYSLELQAKRYINLYQKVLDVVAA
ncbi:MAG: glycosyltransferase [Cyanothece sp. SIO2G6]|nr:glycosyltransferase [Cyanothece sp. SIO2G6]